MRRLRPGSRLLQFLSAAAQRRTPYGLPLPVLIEVSVGAHGSVGRGRDRLIYLANWLSELTGQSGGSVLEELPLTSRSAIAAGRVLARVPMPSKRRQGDAGQQGRSWAADITIAAIAWDHGYGIVLDDSDYRAIVAALPGHASRESRRAGFPLSLCFGLVHSPVVGQYMWTPVSDELAHRGRLLE